MSNEPVSSENLEESYEEMEKRHFREIKELEVQIKLLIKGAGKKMKEFEAKAVQMGYDLRARHREEESRFDIDEVVSNIATPKVNLVDVDDHNNFLGKKEKARKKKEKKASRDLERKLEKDKLREMEIGPSMKELELQSLNNILHKCGLKIKEVAADGHCLYRAIAHQLQYHHSNSHSLYEIGTLLIEDPILKNNWISYSPLATNRNDNGRNDVELLRKLTADCIRQYADEFIPFLSLSDDMNTSRQQLEDYCQKIIDTDAAEWGGQVELKALAIALKSEVKIYDASAPAVTMNNSESNSQNPSLQISYHRHFYTLGEHYNSTERL